MTMRRLTARPIRTIGELKQCFDGGVECVRQSKGENGGRNEDAVLDGVDRLPGYADHFCEIRLREAEPRALFAQSVEELVTHRGARESPSTRTRAVRSHRRP